MLLGEHKGKVDDTRVGVGVVVVCSCVRALALAWACDYLHQSQLSVSVFLFFLMGCVFAYMMLVEKAFGISPRIPTGSLSNSFTLTTSNGPLAKKDLVRIAMYSFVSLSAKLFWYEGLRFTGAIRTILTTDFGDSVFLFVLSLLFASPTARFHPNKVNGTLLLAIGYLILCTFDSPHEPASVDHSFRVWWFGIPESYVGGLSLLVAVFLTSLLHLIRKGMISEGIEGKVCFALTNAFGCLYLLPIIFFSSFISFGSSTITSPTPTPSLFSFSFLFCFSFIVLSTIFDYRTEVIVHKQLRLPIIATLRITSAFLFLSLYDLFTHTPTITSITWLCFLLILLGLYTLLSSPNTLSTPEDFLPLRRAATDTQYGLHINKILKFCSHTLKQILSNTDSRNIFLFLCVNLTFMFVEMSYGLWSNSLGLLSDAFHMLFDCVALGIGLIAAVIAKWDSTTNYTYGYGRVQVWFLCVGVCVMWGGCV
jgi:solute carrier family 30 (zinc transporter), member 5/7